jgi:hypothetical protein
MKKLFVFFIVIQITNYEYLSAQEFKFSNVKPSITKFYEYVYQDSSKSRPDLTKIFDYPAKAYYFKEIKEKYFADLTQGIELDNLRMVLLNIRIHYDGDINTQYAILTSPKKKNIYFALNADSVFQENYPAQIGDIYLSNGKSIISCDCNGVPEKLLFRGLLNPERIKSSLNIHERPETKSISNNKITLNQLFNFSPNESECYEIFNYEDQKSLGLIKKEYIIMFKDFPKPIKVKILREGC